MRRSSKVLCAVAALAVSTSAKAEVVHDWFGNFGGLWNSPVNWGTAGEPGLDGTAWFNGMNPLTIASLITLSADREIFGWKCEGYTFYSFWYEFSATNNAKLKVNYGTEFGFAFQQTLTTVKVTGFDLQTPFLWCHGGVTMNLLGASNVNVATNTIAWENGGLLINASQVTTDLLSSQGNAKIELSNGGIAYANRLTLDQSGTVSVDGTSALHVNGDITIGGGTLTIESGAIFDVTGGSTIKLQTAANSKLVLKREFAVPNGGSLQAYLGGDIESNSYLDVGNNQPGSMVLDGAGTTLNVTGASITDWGRTAAGNANIVITNGARADLTSLRVGTNEGSASVAINAGSILHTSSSFEMGGGANVRTVLMNVNGGLLKTDGAATLNNRADINLLSGVANFPAGLTINAGARIDWTGGGLDTSNAQITVNGGTLAVGTNAVELSSGSTLRVQAGGTVTAGKNFDIANGSDTGTLIVDGAGSTFSSGPSNFGTVWSGAPGKIANVTISNGGVANVDSPVIGINGGAATVNVLSGGTLNATQFLQVGGGSANRSVSLNLTGGTLTANGLVFSNKAVVGLNTGGIINANEGLIVDTGGTLNWSAGILNLSSGKALEVLGGTVNRTAPGTALNPGATLYIAGAGTFTTPNYFDINTGTLHVTGSGSTFAAGGTSYTDWAPNSGNVATVNLLNNGSATFTGAGLRLARAGGTVTLTLNTGGELHTTELLAGGTTGLATINLNHVNAEITATSVTLLQGTTVNYAAGQFNVTGALQLTGNAKILAPATTSTPAIGVGSISIASTSKIDLASGLLQATYSGASPIDILRGYLATGYSGGTWLGNGLTSSFCAANPNYGLAYIDVGASKIIVTKVRSGDADGSGTVEFPDLLAVAQNYNGVGSKHWIDGDFNYDGLVNFEDLLKLAQNYGMTGLSSEDVASLGIDFAADWALAQSLVPEPTALAFVALTVPFLRRRRG